MVHMAEVCRKLKIRVRMCATAVGCWSLLWVTPVICACIHAGHGRVWHGVFWYCYTATAAAAACVCTPFVRHNQPPRVEYEIRPMWGSHSLSMHAFASCVLYFEYLYSSRKN